MAAYIRGRLLCRPAYNRRRILGVCILFIPILLP